MKTGRIVDKKQKARTIFMSQKPVLVIMAAGMGSRYGGLKQIDPVDREGDLIIDFSIFDAVEAGFEKVVFIIKKSIEKEFKEHIGNRMEKHVQVEYVYQENDRLPDGFEVPEGRVKPWGTGHAILCCSEVIDGPFAVINADDYYGKSAFKAIYDRLASCGDDDKYQYAMVAYHLYNTLTENGHVARGVCTVDADGQHPVSLHPGTALQLFSFFCVSLFIGLRYIVVNRCDGSNYCLQIGQNINVFIFCDRKVFDTNRITNLHLTNINFDFLNQCSR